MLYLTQLIYIHPGQEEIFEEFEAVAIPLIAHYSGKLLLRIRPEEDAILEAAVEAPYEIHLVSFPTESDLQNFLGDPTRRQFLHLKEKAIRSSFLIKGNEM